MFEVNIEVGTVYPLWESIYVYLSGILYSTRDRKESNIKPVAGRDGLQSFVRTSLEILWLVSKVNSYFNVIAFSKKLWSSQLWTQFLQLRIEAWKIEDFNGVWTRDLAIPVPNWAMKPLTLGAGHSRVQTPLKSWIFQASIRNCKNCVHNCEDHSLTQFNIWYISSLLHFVVRKVECLYILKILFVIDHFRVPLILSFKASRSAKFWKRIFITVKDFALRFEIETEVNSEILFCPLQAPFETPYVVRLHNVAVISPPQPCFVFVHPNRGL